MPKIDESLIRHFIRDYFDGDGCITGCLCKEKGKSDRIRRHFNIDGKTKTIFDEMQQFFQKYNIKINIIYLKRDDMWRINTSAKGEVEKIFHLLYDDSNFYLKRKFDKFNYYVNTEVSQLIADHRNAQILNDTESNNISTSAEHPNRVKICAEPSDDKSEYSKEETPGFTG